MGRRSRKRRPGEEPQAAPGAEAVAAAEPVPPPQDEPTGPDGRPLSRSQRRDAEARAALVPLAPGERPAAVTVAAVIAVLLAVANVGLWLADVRVKGAGASTAGVLGFAAVMLLAAWGMWNTKYWAVLGFQALLALTIVVASLSLMVAGNLAAVALCLTIMAGGGWLFWKLVRALARIQMPRP